MSNINTILITGASRGLGHALATHFAQMGHTVFAVGRDQTAIEQLEATHPQLIKPIVADITTATGRDIIHKQVMQSGKPLSIIQELCGQG